MSQLHDYVAGVEGGLIEVWHHLHRNPELSMVEFKTADFIEGELKKIPGLHRVKRVGETGVWAELAGAAPRPGAPVVALRGDMDALPIQEATSVPFKSVIPGVMHACGHDIHTSSLLGAVKVLAAHYRDRIPGKVWFFFQPGEEVLSGARVFLEDREIDFSQVSHIAGIHVSPQHRAGQVCIKNGPAMAGSDFFKITVTGQGSHAAFPQGARDPVTAQASLIGELQTLVSRETDPTDSAVLSVCTIHGGTKNNIIPSEVVLEGTFRFLQRSTQKRIHRAVGRVCKGISLSKNVTVRCDMTVGTPPLINDDGCFKRAERALTKAFGKANVLFAPAPMMGSEDFAFFMEKVPGVFMMIGALPRGAEPMGLHTPTFAADPGALRSGVTALCAYALESFGIEP
ncbi:MAG: amidohydrolase [Spirochaetaceae bacterium]|jgi:amidohydrolase/hippurate hydrolase|nr:amidohydrolase [Spirochaetaceae bacterium]